MGLFIYLYSTKSSKSFNMNGLMATIRKCICFYNYLYIRGGRHFGEGGGGVYL